MTMLPPTPPAGLPGADIVPNRDMSQIGATPDKFIPVGERQILSVRKTCKSYKVQDRVLHGDGRHRTSISAPLAVLRPGEVFESFQEIKDRGVPDEDIQLWLSIGALQWRTIGNYLQSDMGGAAPMLLGNTTGDRELDTKTESYPNTQGVKWGWNPRNLTNQSLSTLQARVADRDPTIAMPTSIGDCIQLLSQDFRG